MILCDTALLKLGADLLEPFNPEMVNPSSIDIRIGRYLYKEIIPVNYRVDRPKEVNQHSFLEIDLSLYSQKEPYQLGPKEFVLAETFERIKVPNGYSIDLKLKSSIAREGYNHSLAFWFDPGWDGIGTLELHNVLNYHWLPLYQGMKIGQIVVHQNTGLSNKPYQGNYTQSNRVRLSYRLLKGCSSGV